MKRYSILLLMFLVCGAGFGQKSVRKFYKNVKRGDESVKLTLPGFLIHMGAGIARNHIEDDPDAALALEMTKYIKNIKIVTTESEHAISQNEYMKFVDIARRRDKFEDIIMVKEAGGANVNIMMRGNSKKIKNLLILVKDDEEFVMLSMKTNLKYKHLNKFLEAIIMKDDKIKLEPKATKKAVTKTIDRA
jgi:hypothetical protein